MLFLAKRVALFIYMLQIWTWLVNVFIKRPVGFINQSYIENPFEESFYEPTHS